MARIFTNVLRVRVFYVACALKGGNTMDAMEHKVYKEMGSYGRKRRMKRRPYGLDTINRDIRVTCIPSRSVGDGTSFRLPWTIISTNP